MTLTRETVEKLLECGPLRTQLETKLCTALLAAWDERDAAVAAAVEKVADLLYQVGVAGDTDDDPLRSMVLDLIKQPQADYEARIRDAIGGAE